MVHDRLPGVEMERGSEAKKGCYDPVSEAEEDVLSSLETRAPKEHQIGELNQIQLCVNKNKPNNVSGLALIILSCSVCSVETSVSCL